MWQFIEHLAIAQTTHTKCVCACVLLTAGAHTKTFYELFSLIFHQTSSLLQLCALMVSYKPRDCYELLAPQFEAFSTESAPVPLSSHLSIHFEHAHFFFCPAISLNAPRMKPSMISIYCLTPLQVNTQSLSVISIIIIYSLNSEPKAWCCVKQKRSEGEKSTLHP